MVQKMGKKKTASKSLQKSNKPAPPLTRDVGLQSKGARLQKLRAVLLLVQATDSYPDSHSYAAVELFGDVSLTTADRSIGTQYIEENKNYDLTVAFTMNSLEVLNTLVAFCDFWISHGCSKHVKFGFYCPNNFTTEKNTQRTEKLGISWPKQAVLKHLSLAELNETNVLDATKRAVLGEYELQATKHAQTITQGCSPLGNLGMIRGWQDGKWMDFLRQIQWKFGEDDAASIGGEIINAIQGSPYFNKQLAGKERQVIALLVDMLDKRQAFQDPTQRFMHVAEVVLAFKEVESGAVRLPDPMWEAWKKLPPPTDTRNIGGKVIAVCPDVSSSRIARWSRRAAASMIEQRGLDDDKQVLALKYQLYDACEEELAQIRAKGETVDDARLEEIMNDVVNSATARFTECSKQYHYKIVSIPTVEAMVYELFDSCYLSFDGGELQ